MSRIGSSINKEKRVAQVIRDKKIKSAFDAFDQQNSGCVDMREVGTILRSIGIYPTLEQLHIWVTDMEDQGSSEITWPKFSLVTNQIFNGKYPVKEDEETLFRAFQVLDTERKGYLLPEDIKKYLTTMGEPFTNEEIEEMLAACTDPLENKIYYEDYSQLLSK